MSRSTAPDDNDWQQHESDNDSDWNDHSKKKGQRGLLIAGSREPWFSGRNKNRGLVPGVNPALGSFLLKPGASPSAPTSSSKKKKTKAEKKKKKIQKHLLDEEEDSNEVAFLTEQGSDFLKIIINWLI